jgi:vacuolar-type H+-ATPase subunit H
MLENVSREGSIRRSAVQRVDPPTTRKARDAVITIGFAVILLFALVGLVSAGALIGSKFAKSASAPSATTQPSSSALGAQQLARAKTQATQVVKRAQESAKSIVTSATHRAAASAKTILRRAHQQASSISASRIVAAAPTAPAVTQQNQGQSTSAPSVPSTRSTGVPRPFVGVPSSWMVVAYNATFGTGPGNAGGITLANRSAHVFSGTVTVAYSRGGSATAVFHGLGPHSSIVFPLNGKPYQGGRYRISMSGLR